MFRTLYSMLWCLALPLATSHASNQQFTQTSGNKTLHKGPVWLLECSSWIHNTTVFAVAATPECTATFCTAAAGFSGQENTYKRHFLTLDFFL